MSDASGPLASTSSALPPLEIPPERIRDAVREVLARSEYADLQRNPLERWLDDLRTSLAELLASLLASVPGGILAWGVVLLGATLLVVVGVVLVRRLGSEPTAPTEAAVTHARTPADWAAEAAAHEAAGRWRDAVRAHFRVLTATLVQRGLVEDVPGTTVGEYRSALRRSAPALAGPFDAAAAVFEAVWYAHEPAGPDAVARLRDAGEAVGAGRVR